MARRQKYGKKDKARLAAEAKRRTAKSPAEQAREKAGGLKPPWERAVERKQGRPE